MGLLATAVALREGPRISADHGAAGRHHPGVPIALSTRFSRRPDGIKSLVDAVRAAANKDVRESQRVPELPRQR